MIPRVDEYTRAKIWSDQKFRYNNIIIKKGKRERRLRAVLSFIHSRLYCEGASLARLAVPVISRARAVLSLSLCLSSNYKARERERGFSRALQPFEEKSSRRWCAARYYIAGNCCVYVMCTI